MIIEHQQKSPTLLVHSCSECSMQAVDGRLNLNGILHRTMQTKQSENSSRIDCANCPITTNMSEEEWDQTLADIDGTP